MSTTRILLLPAVVAGLVAAQSASASLVSLQDLEKLGSASLDGAATLEHAATVSGEETPSRISSVFDLQSSEIFFRLMRLIEGGPSSMLGGPFSRSESEPESSTSESALQGIYDLNETGHFHQYVSNFQSSYSLDFAKPGVSASTLSPFSTIGTDGWMPQSNGGFSPAATQSAFSSDSAPSGSSNVATRVAQGPANVASASAPGSVFSPASVDSATPRSAASAVVGESDSLSSQPMSISLVPEPSTGLMVLGAMTLLGLRRRRA